MENLFEILLIGLILSADSFSASLAMGARPHTTSDSLRFALTSGLAEGFVAFLGAMAGANLIVHFNSYGHWLSFILLMLVSIHMLHEGVSEFREKEIQTEKKEFHNFLKVLIVSFATSLDAFAVGVTLGVSEKELLPYIISIALWAFVTTLLGMHIAKRVSSNLGPIFSIVAAIILSLLAISFLNVGLTS